MIQAQSPDVLPNNNPAKDITVTKVHGFGQPKQTKNTSKETKPESSKLIGHIFHWWHKIAIILLTLHGLSGIWESVYFLAVEYPKLNELLQLHIIDVTEVNHLLAKAIISVMVTIVNILFAVRLSQVKETTAHNIDLIVATFLVVTSSVIRDFLYQLDLINLLISYF